MNDPCRVTLEELEHDTQDDTPSTEEQAYFQFDDERGGDE